jgi:hypothetical protein
MVNGKFLGERNVGCIRMQRQRLRDPDHGAPIVRMTGLGITQYPDRTGHMSNDRSAKSQTERRSANTAADALSDEALNQVSGGTITGRIKR